MKTSVIFAGLLSIVAATASAADLSFDTIAQYSPVGPPTVPILKVIENVNQLDSYFVETHYDTTLLSSRPDFASKTVIGLLTMTGGGNRADYRDLMRVVDEIDSIVLEVKPDSQVFAIGISIQAASHVLLFVIPKTDKPIVIRKIHVTAIGKAFQRISKIQYAPQTPDRFYTLQGRSLAKREGRLSGLFITAGERNSAKAIFLKRRGMKSSFR